MGSIPSQEEYERRAAQEFQRQLREADKNPSRRADAKHFGEQLAADPDLIAERIGWLLNGSYGFGAMKAAERVVANTRMNRHAWLVQTIAALEWQCPQRSAIAAWKKLTRDEKRALDAAIKRELRDAEQCEDK